MSPLSFSYRLMRRPFAPTIPLAAAMTFQCYKSLEGPSTSMALHDRTAFEKIVSVLHR